jgi:hypothetical protein
MPVKQKKSQGTKPMNRESQGLVSWDFLCLTDIKLPVE